MTTVQNKPLKLKVYPPKNQPDYECSNCDGRGCMGYVFREYDHDCRNDCPECCYYNEPANKHLTDAELAAEYWCSSWRESSDLTSPEIKIESERRADILYRFAITPHHEERP